MRPGRNVTAIAASVSRRRRATSSRQVTRTRPRARVSMVERVNPWLRGDRLPVEVDRCAGVLVDVVAGGRVGLLAAVGEGDGEQVAVRRAGRERAEVARAHAAELAAVDAVGDAG